ncbi:TonB-dependent receptor [Sinomicrobium soli]|uniref:TonB-dependent receptor n=1 Tax=Sinomicrobium sp. N-1-3-6 TaxID=2219864 RepID=UPI000DCDC77E|nr:TonB-dependent receptor [Sinomicrobium sp. N-1-3-6]RAV27600.1 TonB-dependent receptor [Sinomicrobium sp. N-1-3-6]
MKQIFLLLCCVTWYSACGQSPVRIRGKVADSRSHLPVAGAYIRTGNGGAVGVLSGEDGSFILLVPRREEIVLYIGADGYLEAAYPVEPPGEEEPGPDLGIVFLRSDIAEEMAEGAGMITASELEDDESGAEVAPGILQASGDIYLQRAAFDLGQAFFKVRGYDAAEGVVMLNGIPVNKLFNGRPQWNNWGGLNDVLRNREFSFGLSPSSRHFGGILGSTDIRIRPSALRPGFRLSASASDRFYNNRLMATYNSGVRGSGLAFSLSASRRWAVEAYTDGTLYDAWSLFGAVEYRWNPRNSIQFTGMWTPNRRGGSAALTEEVRELAGARYNPYWGTQDGKIRNSRERRISEPLVLLSYDHEGERLELHAGAMWQSGSYARDRLGYFNAPNPDPVYYRYLPGFYINSPSGANFDNALLARESFLRSPQLDWASLYRINRNPGLNGQAAYMLYADHTDDRTLAFNLAGSYRIAPWLRMDAGGSARSVNSHNYAEIRDLLGAGFHVDKDPFTETLNDMEGPLEKRQGERFSYDYIIDASQYRGFVQFQAEGRKWDAFLSGSAEHTSYRRNGLYRNGRFPENSEGKGEALRFSGYGIKGGTGYRFTDRHILRLQGGYILRAPVLQNVFVNPRENNRTVDHIGTETVWTADVSYLLRLPGLKAKLTGYFTEIDHAAGVSFFYVDAGVGSDFVQQALTGIGKRYTGGELGVSYELSPEVKLTAVGALGKFTYSRNPRTAINFDTAGREEDLINPDGFLDLGMADLKGYRLSTGPQQAVSIGIEYRDPDYWWAGMTANYLADSFVDVSAITRTQSFFLDPETGSPFPDATPERVGAMLRQERLEPVYLLNLTGGKSWLIKGKYIGVFVSVNNVFDRVYPTGGYEQSRNGNFGQMEADRKSGNPSFGNKYWYGHGRTYFLNLVLSY